MRRRISDETRLRQKRGTGTGKSYTPWIKVREIPSKGRVHRVLSFKTGRIHHLLSDLEFKVYCILNYSTSIIDIREQYPLLSIEQTRAIANELGIKHPGFVHKGQYIDAVMTTDFLVTVSSPMLEKLIAICVKPFCDLQKRRVKQKIALERMYWEKLGIEFRIITDKEIPQILTNNLRLLDAHATYSGNYSIEKFTIAFKLNITVTGSLESGLVRVAGICDIPVPDAKKIFLHLIFSRVIDFNICEVPFDWNLKTDQFTHHF